MNTLPRRAAITDLIDEAVLGGARLAPACALLGFSERTLQRWQLEAEDSPDGRTLRHDAPAHKLSAAERETLLAVANSAEFGHLPPSQIVPRLADQSRYIASESTVHGQYVYLYIFLDVFSRKIVAWQIYAEENGAHASELMRDLCRRERIAPGQLVLHSDNVQFDAGIDDAGDPQGVRRHGLLEPSRGEQ
jgi:transposase InsO family protein